MIPSNINEHCYQLTMLLESLPAHNGYRSISELNQVFNRYLKILDSVNSYNETYKSATRIYYADITDIRDNMQELLNADNPVDREKAFQNARNGLTADLRALSTLLKPHPELIGS